MGLSNAWKKFPTPTAMEWNGLGSTLISSSEISPASQTSHLFLNSSLYLFRLYSCPCHHFYSLFGCKHSRISCPSTSGIMKYVRLSGIPNSGYLWTLHDKRVAWNDISLHSIDSNRSFWNSTKTAPATGNFKQSKFHKQVISGGPASYEELKEFIMSREFGNPPKVVPWVEFLNPLLGWRIANAKEIGFLWIPKVRWDLSGGWNLKF